MFQTIDWSRKKRHFNFDISTFVIYTWNTMQYRNQLENIVSSVFYCSKLFNEVS